MKKLIIICALVVMFAASSAEAVLTVQDFEGLPDLYYYYGGNTNLGTFLPGLTFGSDATILDKVIYGYNDSGYPPHSGDAVLFSDSDPVIRVDFDTSVSYAELWYTAIGDFYMEAYDAGNALVDSVVGAANYGSNALLSVSGANIAYLLLHDTGDYYTIDDLAYETSVIPAPGAILLGSIGISLVGWLRRRKTL